MKTATVRSYMAKPGEVEQKWWLVDADQKVVGRLASDIAVILSETRAAISLAARANKRTDDSPPNFLPAGPPIVIPRAAVS